MAKYHVLGIGYDYDYYSLATAKTDKIYVWVFEYYEYTCKVVATYHFSFLRVYGYVYYVR